jgi:hypothetical protein
MKTGTVNFGEFQITIELLPARIFRISAWKNVTDENGNILECTDENIRDVLLKCPNLNDELCAAAPRLRASL